MKIFTGNAPIPTGKAQTSKDSRDEMQKTGRGDEVRTLLYNFIAMHPATYDEFMLAYPSVCQGTASTFVSNLRQKGEIYDTGERRKTRWKRDATVWAVRKNPVLVRIDQVKCSRCKGSGVVDEPIWKEGDTDQ
jgi:hypothetical protein